jgi:hypothetical protein
VKQLLFVMIVAIGACSTTTSPNALPAEAWDVGDYTKAGVPSPDATWTAEQHETAATALETAVAGAANRGRLPRLGGARSGPVFARIAEKPQIDDVLLDPVNAFGVHLRRFNASDRIGKLYLVNDAAAPPVEYIALFGAQLAEAALLEPGAAQILALTPADAPEHAARVEGHGQMREGWGAMLLGGTMMLADVRVPETARIGLAKDLREPLQTLFPKLQPQAQTLIKKQLQALHEHMRSGVLHDALPPVP